MRNKDKRILERIEMDRKDWIQIILLIVMFVSGFYLYQFLPEQVPLHWGPDGRPDSYGSKFFAVIVVPILTLILYLMLKFVPHVMTYKENFKKFEKYYDDFRLVLVLFFFFLYVFTLIPGFGYKVNMNYFIIPALAILFYYIGSILPKMKRNFFIGIRTPWTLASEEVWDKTHKNSAWLFKIGGIFFILAAIFKDYFIWIIVGYVLLIILFVLVYSCFLYKKGEDKYEKDISKATKTRKRK